MKDKQHLIGSLAYWLAAGKLEAGPVLPGIQKLTEERPQPVPALLESLGDETDADLVSLAGCLRQNLRKEALRIHDARQRQLPVAAQDNLVGLNLDAAEPWQVPTGAIAKVETALRMSRELAFLATHQEKTPILFRRVQQEACQALADACAAITVLIERLPQHSLDRIGESWPAELPGRDRAWVQIQERSSSFHRRWLEQAGRVVPSLPDSGEWDDDSLPGKVASLFAAAGRREEKAALLDLACSWRTPESVPGLGAMGTEPWARDRAVWNLTLRFGRAELETWESWQRWLETQEQAWQTEQQALGALLQDQAPGLLLVLYSQLLDRDPAVLDALVKRVGESSPPVNLSELLISWANWTPLHERRALLELVETGHPGRVPPVIVPSGAVGQGHGAVVPGRIQPPPLPPRQAEPTGAPVPLSPMKKPAAPSTPPKPSAWEVHIQPFFVENWYIVAGIAMVILGSSLLAYYTWDKHWLVRYTIMPLLLGGFTWSLARVGDWIEKKSAEFKGTAAILRGAAIGLLPINFMAMALLSADHQVTHKGVALLAMAIIYLSVFGWGLSKWCGAVEPSLGARLGGTLLLLNALVGVGPLARTVGHLEGQSLWLCLGAGFYVGFAATAAAIVHFARTILTREMAQEKRVPWFVATALGVTFLQVFIWVHGFMRHLPQAHVYALMVILMGWLVLYAERRALELKASPRLHGGESFLGFGAVLLGLLMGFGNPTVRIVSFLVAGAVWLYQGLSRQHPLHHWIALTLLGLGGASVGLLPRYPGPWLPLLGVAVALAFGLGASLSRRKGLEVAAKPAPAPDSAEPKAASQPENRRLLWPAGLSELAQACRGMQMVALLLTALIAPLVQWHYSCEPLGTAGWLLLVAGLFACRAFEDEQVRWLHAAMAMLALALPYAGFMDVAGRTAHNNTMVFGLGLLSWLWLAATWVAPKPLVLQARSTVLWLYGILAVAAMLLRVALGDTLPQQLWYRDCMDYGGPILMMLALIPATYYSRSLVPAAMAVAIMAILFPELKANFERSLPWLAWGTGLGSAIGGLALIGLCFVLRPWPPLRDLPEGDRFMGRELFPFRRANHTLFTWPLLAAAIWLLVKVDSWHLLRNLAEDGVPLKTALALGISGVAWTLTAIYHRQHRAALAGVHLGWLCLLAAIGLGYWRQASDPHWTRPALIMGLLLQGLYWLYRFSLEPTRPWARKLLTEPMRQVLLVGSAVLAVVEMASLLGGASLEKLQWLYGFLALQLVWHAFRTRHWVWGALVFFQIWIGLLALTAPGSAPLWERVSVEKSLSPTLWLLVGIQLLLAALEKVRTKPAAAADSASGGQPPEVEAAETGRSRGLQGLLVPILTPVSVLATCLACLLGLAGLADGVHGLALSGPQQLLLLLTLLLTARAQASSPMLLPAMLLGYLMTQRRELAGLDSLDRQLELLATPWRLGLLGLAMVLLTQAGRWAHRRNPRLMVGSFALPAFTAPSSAWLCWPAVVLSGAAALYHLGHPVLRESGAQLWTPYLGMVTFALVAWFWRQAGFFAGAGFLLVLGNIHLVRVFCGEYLRSHGLSELHLVCLGLGLSLLQASGLRRAISSSAAIPAINRTSLGLGGLILALLSANYFTEPSLATFTPTRFSVSGLLAWLAGWYFRRAARHPAAGEENHADLCEALYHFGLVVAFWCAALLIPWFRSPIFALVALGLPVAFFYAQAEWGLRRGRSEARRYRNSAAVLGFAVLGLYFFKGVFHMVLFPGTPIGTQHYHYNAPLILLLGLVLMRLHGLGGTSWLAFYGGLALMTGSYFLLTALPGLSPFDDPMPAAWCALGLGHFWILLSYERSPVRTFIQRLAVLDDPSWDSLRQSWGRCLLAATQGAVLSGLVDFSANTFMAAPLVAGAATIWIHQGMLRRSPLYLIVAGAEIAAALHADFLIPSYLPRHHIIWVVLVIWLGFLIDFQLLKGKLPPKAVGGIALALGCFALGHVLYHRPWTPVGLWGMGLAAMLAAWTPIDRTAMVSEKSFGALLLLMPLWLVGFSQAPFEERGLAAARESWPILTSTATLLLIGLAGRWFPVYGAAAYHSRPRTQARLFDLSLGWLESDGPAIHRATLCMATAILCAIQLTRYQTAFAVREFGLLALLEVASAAAWFVEGKTRQSMTANYLMQLCALAFFASVRRHLMLTTSWWHYEYDVWASLAFSFGLAGAKQVLDQQPRSLRVPLVTTLCALPVLALIWVALHGLGVNLALMVVGLHGVLFAYLGKDNRESPYNILALAGFVGFILLTFYSKLHLRAIHAYIIPVGLGVLILQELLKKRIPPEARNWIRLVTLMAMLGSSGYYALADTRHAITFNLTMIILCLMSMGLGSLLRIRLYLALGFAGLMVDLLSLLYKVLVLMERSARMTVVGSLVLLIGAILVFGAIYYKTNKASINAWIDQWRARLAQWQ